MFKKKAAPKPAPKPMTEPEALDRLSRAITALDTFVALYGERKNVEVSFGDMEYCRPHEAVVPTDAFKAALELRVCRCREQLAKVRGEK